MTANARREPSSGGPQRPIPQHRVAAVAMVAVAALLGLVAAEPRSVGLAKDDHFLTVETPGVLHIEVGECFSDPFFYPRAGEVVVLYTPCEEPPVDNQTYGFVDAPDGPWDRDRLADFAWRRCGDGYATYWPDGKQSDLDYYPVLPTEQTWADGDRTVMCVVYDPAGRMTGSALQLAR